MSSELNSELENLVVPSLKVEGIPIENVDTTLGYGDEQNQETASKKSKKSSTKSSQSSSSALTERIIDNTQRYLSDQKLQEESLKIKQSFLNTDAYRDLVRASVASANTDENRQETDQEKIRDEKLNFRRLFNRFTRKSKIYSVAASWYRTLDNCCFIIPILVFQVISGVIPLFENQSILGNSTKVLSTALATLTAALIGCQVKYNFNAKSIHFERMAGMYRVLANHSYFNYLSMGISVSEFIKYAMLLEKDSSDGVPNVPYWAEKLYSSEIDFSKEFSCRGSDCELNI